jgi:hypothetical protein
VAWHTPPNAVKISTGVPTPILVEKKCFGAMHIIESKEGRGGGNAPGNAIFMVDINAKKRPRFEGGITQPFNIYIYICLLSLLLECFQNQRNWAGFVAFSFV